MSPVLRSFSLPRSAGTMQKVQVLLQPTEMETQAAYALSRRVGSVDGNASSDSAISTCASSCTRARSRRTGKLADVVRTEDDVHPGRLLHHGVAVLLGQAAADGDLHPGALRLHRREAAEVAVQPVVGVLPDGAGVEDDDVRVPVGPSRARARNLRLRGARESRSESWTFIWHP